MNEVILSLVCGIGLSLVVVGMLLRVREREQSLAQILELPWGEHDVPVEAVTEGRGAMFEGTVGFAGRVVDRFDARGGLSALLERSQLPVRPGEFVLMAGAGSLVLGILIWMLTASPLLGAAAVIAGPFVAITGLKVKIDRRRKAFEAQLPDALSLIASSLSAGHTFLRSIQMMCEEAEAPLAEEFERVVAETRLGDSVVEALDRMARRLEVEDLVWVVQAIRIQQQVGGKLADILHTLADYIRGREEVRREVQVLTAEGRISGWVLGLMPVALLVALKTISPGYLDPLFHGKGLFVLGFAGAMVVAGMVVIRRMVNIEV